MLVLNDYKEHIKIEEPVALALGFFDGFHIGHMRLLDTARATGLSVGVVTFANSPRAFVQHETAPRTLMPNSDKIRFLAEYGVKYLIMPPFDEKMMNMSKEDFIKYFIRGSQARSVVSGFNFTFGRGCEGRAADLPALLAPYGIECSIIPAVTYGGEVVSSTLIKKELSGGNVSKAAALLGRLYSISGEVIAGKKLGRQLGFPTANIAVRPEVIVPGTGVYASYAEFAGRRYNAVTNVGTNPTVGGGALSVETHLLDFNDSMYGQELRIFFRERLRDQIKFADTAALAAQVQRDIARVGSMPDEI